MNKSFSVPKGMRDLILDECRTKRDLQNKIEKCFESWGYEEVITPSIEYFQTYNVGFNGIQEEDAYKFFDRSGKILMLRADMTIPIARVAATKFQNAKLPLRFYYEANVYKAHANLKGMHDEVTDCGVELIGCDEESGELEILVTALEVLKLIGDKHIVFEIGNVKYFQKACEVLQLTQEQIYRLSELIDNKRLKALDDYLKELKLNETASLFFNQLPWLSGDEKILSEAKKYAFDPSLVEIINNMEKLNSLLKRLGYQDIHYDLGKATNINYYTGLIFEAFIEGVGTRILSGGSYNKLIGKYGKNLNATGFSIKIDSLLEVVPMVPKASYLLLKYPSYLTVEAFSKAKELRKENIVKLEIDNSINEIEIEEVA